MKTTKADKSAPTEIPCILLKAKIGRDNAQSQINPVYPYAWEQSHAEPQRSISVPSATGPSLRLRVTVEGPI